MHRPATTLVLLAALALAGCSGHDTLRIRAVSPPLPDAMRRVRIALDLEGYETDHAVEDHRMLVTTWKAETSGASRLVFGFAPRGGMYDVTLRVERRARGQGSGESVGREDPLMRKWEQVLRSLVAEEPKED